MKRLIFLALVLGSYLIFGFALPSFAKLPLLTNQRYVTQVESKISNSKIDGGKALYDAGRFSEAVKVLEEVVRQYQQQGDTLKQAAALSNLSLAYQQLGAWTEAKQAIAESLRLFGNGGEGQVGRLSLTSPTLQFPFPAAHKILAQTLVIQGRLFWATGQTEKALESWKYAEKLFTRVGETSGVVLTQINQAQALQILGFYRNAVKILEQVNDILRSQSDSTAKIVGLRSLGNALQAIGDLQQSRTVLQKSLEVSQKLRIPEEIGASLLSLGNNARSRHKPQEAIDFYKQSIKIAPSSLAKVQVQLNYLSLLIEIKRYNETNALISSIQPQIDQIPLSRPAIYARINFAQSLAKLGSGEGEGKKVKEVKEAKNEFLPTFPSPTPSSLLATAIESARTLGDKRSEAYGLGELGHLYEKTRQFKEAQQLTEKALVIGQSVNASEITYQLQWQLGRLLKAQGDIANAIASYDSCVETLRSLRSDLVAVNQDVQFNFRESVEPIYRESVALLLETQQGQQDQKILDIARQRIEALQLAELDNFFQEACLQGQKVILDNIVERDTPSALSGAYRTSSAILYPIILADSLQVIVKIPKHPLKLYTTKITDTEVEKTLTQLRSDLIDPSALRDLKKQSQQVYNWLIKPIEAQLAKSQVNTLVFILDGQLRNIPMSVLYDGKNYLVEKYAVTLNPGLQLLDPKPLVKEKLNALTAGLTEPPINYPDFAPLPAIKDEFDLIAKAGVTTTTLIDKQFTSTALERKVNDAPFNVIHLATHGKFSSRAEDTYILAADGPIHVKQLSSFLRSRNEIRPEAIQLLVLSACQTAVGDKRAALGLAGVAIRAGARSTVASLWQIDDDSTAIFVGSFYQQLKDSNINKAEALRRAQLELLNHPNYNSPSYWSAYVLIGNWL
jgi:CHAT domain-containing protein